MGQQEKFQPLNHPLLPQNFAKRFWLWKVGKACSIKEYWLKMTFSYQAENPFLKILKWIKLSNPSCVLHVLCCAVLSRSVVSDSLRPYGLQPANLLCPRGFSRQEYWGGLPWTSQAIFPTQGSNHTVQSPALQVDSLSSEPLVCLIDPQIKIQCVYHIVFQLIHHSTNIYKEFILTMSKQALYYMLEIHPLTTDNLCGCYT